MHIFPIQVVRHRRLHYFIRCGNDDTKADCILIRDGTVVRFDSLELLQEFAANEDLPLRSSAITRPIDLDAIADWTSGKEEFSASKVLNAWNLLSDFRDLESQKWTKFRSLSESSAASHSSLSKYVIQRSLQDRADRQTIQVDYAALVDLMRSAVSAFDESMAAGVPKNP